MTELIHCQMMIREAYFGALHGSATNQTTHHVNHCLDYLRQALICHADANLEYRVASESGDAAPTGYGEHQCQDFDALFDFAEAWRVWNGKSGAERAKISEQENPAGRVINYDYISSRGDPPSAQSPSRRG